MPVDRRGGWIAPCGLSNDGGHCSAAIAASRQGILRQAEHLEEARQLAGCVQHDILQANVVQRDIGVHARRFQRQCVPRVFGQSNVEPAKIAGGQRLPSQESVADLQRSLVTGRCQSVVEEMPILRCTSGEVALAEPQPAGEPPDQTVPSGNAGTPAGVQRHPKTTFQIASGQDRSVAPPLRGGWNGGTRSTFRPKTGGVWNRP